MTDTTRLLRFYDGTSTDHRGRSLADILAYDHDALERHHDFIQWLFPLPEPSPVNPLAPCATSEAIAAFHARPELREALRASLALMLDFYGFQLQRPGGGSGSIPPHAPHAMAVMRAANWASATRNWLTPGNHNFLRLTRILRSCALLGLDEEARALQAALEEVYAEVPEVIGARTMAFWRRAT